MNKQKIIDKLDKLVEQVDETKGRPYIAVSNRIYDLIDDLLEFYAIHGAPHSHPCYLYKGVPIKHRMFGMELYYRPHPKPTIVHKRAKIKSYKSYNNCGCR